MQQGGDDELVRGHGLFCQLRTLQGMLQRADRLQRTAMVAAHLQQTRDFRYREWHGCLRVQGVRANAPN